MRLIPMSVSESVIWPENHANFTHWTKGMENVNFLRIIKAGKQVVTMSLGANIVIVSRHWL